MEQQPEKQMEYVLVETMSTHRMRYLVQVPKGKKDYALDTVVMNEAKEFSQEWIGENIFNARIVSEELALQMCDEDNDYAKTWSSDQKIKVFFTLWEDKSDE